MGTHGERVLRALERHDSEDDAVNLLKSVPIGFNVNDPVEKDEYDSDGELDETLRCNLLETALKNGLSESARLMLSMGAIITENAVSNAVLHPELLRLLLRSGANVTRKNVMFAANCNGESLTILLEAGAEYNFQNNYGESPLYHACASHNYGSVNVLLAAGAQLHEYGGRLSHIKPFMYDHKITAEKVATIDRLIRAGAQVTAAHLSGAAREGNQELVDLLLSHGAELPPPSQVELWRAGRHPRQVVHNKLAEQNMPDELIRIVLEFVVVNKCP